MEREILYKGKRVDKNEFVQGKLITNKLGSYIITDENPHFCSQYGYIELDHPNNVIPETVSQFIRLDSAKKRVFEGDVLDEEYTAKWSNENCGFYLKSKFGSDHNKPMSFIDENNLKVTGTIHPKK